MEKIIVERTTPYGFKLKDGSYAAATKQVRGFVKDYLPCELEILEYAGKEISKVAVVAHKGESKPEREPLRDQFRTPLQIIRQECLTLAVNLNIAGKINLDVLKDIAEEFEKWIVR